MTEFTPEDTQAIENVLASEVVPTWAKLAMLGPSRLTAQGEMLVRLNLRAQGRLPGKTFNYKGNK